MGGCQSSSASATKSQHEPKGAWVKKARIVFVLGGPGSGKGTQCTRACESFGMVHLSSGDLLRQEVASGSERGKQCESIMKDGGLVPVSVTLDLLWDAMEAAVRDRGVMSFLVDGFPRELGQVKAFQAKFHRDCDFALYFECSEAAMKARIMKRGETSGRADDNEATVAKRLKTFADQTMPLVSYYEGMHKLHKTQLLMLQVNADRSVEDIYKDADLFFRQMTYSGGPGSGKGTQSAKIAEKCMYKHLSTGDLLRAETELGQRCAAIMASGGLVPVEDTLELLYAAVLKGVHVNTHGFLVDGFPRELGQVDAFVKKFGRDCNFALYFECSEAVMLERILSRGKSSGRADDNEEAGRKRLVTFNTQSMPVIKHYEKKRLLKKVNADRPVEEVFQSALSAVSHP